MQGVFQVRARSIDKGHNVLELRIEVVDRNGHGAAQRFSPISLDVGGTAPYAPPAPGWGMQRMARASAVDWPANHLAPNFQALRHALSPLSKQKLPEPVHQAIAHVLTCKSLPKRLRQLLFFTNCLAPNLRPDRYAPVLQT